MPERPHTFPNLGWEERNTIAEMVVAELEETVHVYGAALGDIEVEADGSVNEDRLKLNSRLRNVIILARKALKPVEPKGNDADVGS